MGVKNAKKLAKQELVYKILDQQALMETPQKKQNDDSNDRKMRPRKRENVAPTPSANTEMPRQEPEVTSQPEFKPAAQFEPQPEERQPKEEAPSRPSQAPQQPPQGNEIQQQNDSPPDRQQQNRILHIKDFDGADTS